MALDRSTQPIVKDASGVLVGVAQVRVGKPSIREALSAPVIATRFVAVGKTKKVFTSTNGSVIMVRPTETYAANTLAPSAGAAAGSEVTSVTVPTSYTGKIDGCFIVRAYKTADEGIKASTALDSTAAGLELFDPYGQLVTKTVGLVLNTTATASTVNTGASAPTTATPFLGATFNATFTGAKDGDTWVLPVWTSAAININQTGIISPFSLFYDAADSIGGLKSASFQPKIDGIKKLESGFPSYVADQVIDKVSVDVSWNGYEYTNSKLNLLKQMVARVINTGELSAISVEMVMRTRGGSLVRMWIPSCTFTSLPTYAPTNDYSDVAFAMSALKQTEFSTITSDMGIDDLSKTGSPSPFTIYNAWLGDTVLYSELTY